MTYLGTGWHIAATCLVRPRGATCSSWRNLVGHGETQTHAGQRKYNCNEDKHLQMSSVRCDLKENIKFVFFYIRFICDFKTKGISSLNNCKGLLWVCIRSELIFMAIHVWIDVAQLYVYDHTFMQIGITDACSLDALTHNPLTLSSFHLAREPA